MTPMKCGCVKKFLSTACYRNKVHKLLFFFPIFLWLCNFCANNNLLALPDFTCTYITGSCHSTYWHGRHTRWSSNSFPLTPMFLVSEHSEQQSTWGQEKSVTWWDLRERENDIQPEVWLSDIEVHKWRHGLRTVVFTVRTLNAVLSLKCNNTILGQDGQGQKKKKTHTSLILKKKKTAEETQKDIFLKMTRDLWKLRKSWLNMQHLNMRLERFLRKESKGMKNAIFGNHFFFRLKGSVGVQGVFSWQRFKKPEKKPAPPPKKKAHFNMFLRLQITSRSLSH